MRQYVTLLQKEFAEAWAGFKWIWVPLVFMLLGISDPIINYFMKDILAAVGNVPKGFEEIFPTFTSFDILAATTGQFQSVGLIIIVAIFAASISRERQNGNATLLYVRPLSFFSYFLSKWTVAMCLISLSVGLGYGASMYYTAILYGKVGIAPFLGMVATYCIWTLFAATFTLAMSASFRTAIALTISIIIFPIGVIITSIIGDFWTYAPWQLPHYAISILNGRVDWPNYFITLGITVATLIASLLLGIWMSKKQAATTKI